MISPTININVFLSKTKYLIESIVNLIMRDAPLFTSTYVLEELYIKVGFQVVGKYMAYT